MIMIIISKLMIMNIIVMCQSFFGMNIQRKEESEMENMG